MKTGLSIAVSLLIGMFFTSASAQTPVPFKLGTLQRGNETFVGLVLRDSVVAHIGQASAALERASGGAKTRAPRDMKELISRYEELRPRLSAIAAAANGSGRRPGYVYDLKSLKILPPVMYPTTILNAAVNFREHDAEMQARPGADARPKEPPKSIPGIWDRKPEDTRQNPYLFPKPISAVIADGEAIRIPIGRERIDWECELNVVIGRTARRVPIERAAEHIFGYTLQNDVSDRGGRGDGRHGSDWLMGKAHDSFAPLGPFIVPKEFVKDPQKLAIKFRLNDKVMQDSNTERMTHNVFEMLSYASNIVTLRPGDVISMGSPAGVGTARETPIYMRHGDLSVCSIEGIGTLTNPVVGPEQPNL
ncbi:MAG TPA: fumarylacetoacetate hydrolase family protein [Candidatus Udaeobacter sp.]|nr:fumarylacetoacetate hydrolase family protein [Candidatus Udaeobacter sp.]